MHIGQNIFIMPNSGASTEMSTVGNTSVDSSIWFWVLGWFFSLLTIAGNGLVTFFIFKNAQLQTKPNCFIASLAIADFFVGLAYFPPIFIKSLACPNSRICGEAFFITRHFFQYCSAMNLCSMLADRYISIIKPLQYVTLVTRKRMIMVLAASWIVPLIAFVVPGTILFLDDNELDKVFAIFRTLMFATFPMFLSVALSIRVLALARNIARELQALNAQVRFNYESGTLDIKTTSPDIFKRQATVRMMIVVMGIFILGSAAESWKDLCLCGRLACCAITKDVAHILDLLCIINSAVNPIAYAFLKSDIKQQLKRLRDHSRC